MVCLKMGVIEAPPVMAFKKRLDKFSDMDIEDNA